MIFQTIQTNCFSFLVKPRASFWSELNLFMNSYKSPFQADGRTVEEIGKSLGLSPTAMHYVQQDANRPDKVAMNVWRKLCPTREHRLYVGSITRVPEVTLQNIYSKSIDFTNE